MIMTILIIVFSFLSSTCVLSATDDVHIPESDSGSRYGDPPIPPVAGLPQPAVGIPQTTGHPLLKMVAPGTFEIGEVRIIKKEQHVVFPAVVNMDRGLLEYLIVGTTGKIHESLLRTDVEPYLLHIAMLLVGLEGTGNPLSIQGDSRPPEGDFVDIWVEWKDGEETRRRKIEEWVVNKRDDSALKPMHWVFTGSVIVDGIFMAQSERSIAALFHDPVALIDNPLPDGSSDEWWHVNEGAVPTVGTNVTVTIQKATAR